MKPKHQLPLAAAAVFAVGLLAGCGSGNGERAAASPCGSGREPGASTSQPRAAGKPANDSFPSWSPDGCKLAFVSDRDGSARIYVMNADGSKRRQLSASPAGGPPAWSPDGRRIAFARGIYRDGGPPAQIVVLGVNGSSQQQLTRDANTGYSFGSVDPAWSPDGAELAFVSDRETRSNGFDQIYVMNADGSNPQKLTRNPGTLHLQHPAWSPNGQKIAFSGGRNEPPVTDQIYVMNADGNNKQQLTRVGRNSFPTWSPDGRKIAYMCAREGPPVTSRICVMNADGSNRDQLTTTGLSGFPSWSPDGRLIAFVIERAGNDQIYFMKANGSNPRPVTNK